MNRRAVAYLEAAKTGGVVFLLLRTIGRERSIELPSSGAIMNTVNSGDVLRRVGMKTRTSLILPGTGLFLLVTLVFIGPARADRCVILEKQGSLATINCPGSDTTTLELGGRSDNYRVGDTIDVINRSRNQTGSNSRPGTDSRSSTDPRSGRR